ncbi:unnamed protein product [Paramecium sonneborni]|uniref:RING-type domain-containing protein n=1 Tax=Paramecium sonneborni TaxID=65129 RepID=A0A8S1KUG3_9CILI|nr:unnamed protein product [Paramecium sonneborni]
MELDFKESYICEICKVYVQKSFEQIHLANCQLNKNENLFWNKNIQNKIASNKTNKLYKSQFNFNGMNQNSTPQVQFITMNNQQGNLNKEGENIQQPLQIIQKPQFQINQRNGNQIPVKSFNQQGQNLEIKLKEFNKFEEDSKQSNEQTKQEQFQFQRLPQIQFSQKNEYKNQILLNYQQQNKNFSQFNNEQIFNQNINNQQQQEGKLLTFKNQLENQEQIQQTQNPNQKDFSMKIQFQNNFEKPQFPQKSSQMNNSTQNIIFNQKKNLEQNQTQKQQSQQQQFQQQQQKIEQNNQQFPYHNKFQTSLFQTQTVNNNNYVQFNKSNNSIHQFSVPQNQFNIQPAPQNYQFQSLFLNRFQDDQIQISGKGLPNFDVNKKYSDYDVNQMNQEQIYQYFSNLLINEDHGYTEDQINQKLYQNFQIQVEDNTIDICVICQESFTQETFTTDKQLPCSHLFHVDCLQGWLKRSKNCPICKFLIEL